MANKIIPSFLKSLKERMRDRINSKNNIEVKKEIIIVDPKRNTRSIRTQDLRYFDAKFSPREIKRWYVAREITVI